MDTCRGGVEAAGGDPETGTTRHGDTIRECATES